MSRILGKFSFIAFWLIPFFLQGQILKPAKWDIQLSKTDVRAGEEIDLILKATVDEVWYLYANDFDPDCGPLLTEIKFSDIKNFQPVGKLMAIHSIPKHDEIFDCDVKIFKKNGEFRQRIKVLGGPLSITGSIGGQVCTEIEGKCVSFEEDFSFSDIRVTGVVKGNGPVDKNVTETISPSSKADGTTANDTNETRPSDSISKPLARSPELTAVKGPHIDRSILAGEPSSTSNSLLGYMLLAFVLGLTSLITPCVFPMIPMTVTFFLKDNQTRQAGIRKALFFGASIIVIYTVAGTLFAVLFGAEGLNALATHWIPNLLVFFLFILFALSFLGLFEINAPYQLVNKADRGVDKGGVAGIFFMSATLVLVSFSCTIPIIGNVLVLSAGGQIIKPVLGMLAYSLAFAIPFTVFAIFPEWLKSMPRSGGWLNTIK
jgi:thiol:disulfide interchange protein